jgi:hypothetical protein
MIGLYILGGFNLICTMILGVYVYISRRPTMTAKLTATSSVSPFISDDVGGCDVDFPDSSKMDEVLSLEEQDKLAWRRERLNG